MQISRTARRERGQRRPWALQDSPDGDAAQAVLLGETLQLGGAHHGARVVVHHLAEHSAGPAARQAGEVDGRLRVPRALQDAEGARL